MKVQQSENRKLQRKKLLELSLIVSLMLHIFLLQGFKKANLKTVRKIAYIPTIDIVDIPVIKNEKPAPPPKLPEIPMISQIELPPDVTIDVNNWEPGEHLLPPPPPPEIPPFVPYDKPPEPEGGLKAIAKNLIYPEIARRSGFEGKVFIEVAIDELGNVVSTRVLKSSGFQSCDEAAEKAIRAVKWIPAMQRDRPVKVWISIPVEFKLAKR